MNKRRVVITGMGAITPIGIGLQEFWQGLIELMKQTLTKYETVSDIDCDLITLTDGVDEIVSIMKEHRVWKKQQIELARKK